MAQLAFVVLLILSGVFGIRGEEVMNLTFLAPDSVLASEWESAFKLSVELINELAVSQASNVSVKGTTINTSNCTKDNLTDTLLNSAAHGLVGPAYTSCAVTLSKGLGSQLSLVSYSATGDKLSNKTLNPHFFRICPGDQQQGKALATIVEKFWKSSADGINVVGDSGEYSSSLTGSFIKEGETLGLDMYTYILLSSDDVTFTIAQLKNSSRTVTVVLTESGLAEKIFLEAKNEGLVVRGHYWLGADSVAVLDVSGKPALRHALQGVLVTAPKGGGSTSSSYFSLLSKWLSKSQQSFPGIIWSSKLDVQVSPYVPQIYDAVLAYYHAFKQVPSNSSKETVREELAKQLGNIKDASSSINGSLGVPVFFDPVSSSGPAVYSVANLQGETWEKVGVFEDDALSMHRPVIWTGDNLDSAYTTSEEKEDYIHLAVVLAVVLGIFFLLCIGLYHLYRNKQSLIENGYTEKSEHLPSLIHRNHAAYEHNTDDDDFPSTYFDEERKIEVTHL